MSLRHYIKVADFTGETALRAAGIKSKQEPGKNAVRLTCQLHKVRRWK